MSVLRHTLLIFNFGWGREEIKEFDHRAYHTKGDIYRYKLGSEL